MRTEQQRRGSCGRRRTDGTSVPLCSQQNPPTAGRGRSPLSANTQAGLLSPVPPSIFPLITQSSPSASQVICMPLAVYTQVIFIHLLHAPARCSWPPVSCSPSSGRHQSSQRPHSAQSKKPLLSFCMTMGFLGLFCFHFQAAPLSGLGRG